MVAWREQKRKALGDIHRTFQVPAVYLTHAAGTPVRVNVRLHIKPIVSDPNLDENGPTYLDHTNRIVFDAAEVSSVLTNCYVIFSNSEAYLTGPSKPWRDGYFYVEVSEVSQADLTAFLNGAETDHPAFDDILNPPIIPIFLGFYVPENSQYAPFLMEDI